MGYKNYAQVKAIQEKYKKQFMTMNPDLNNNPGIYFFTRVDEDGNKSAYVGQSVHVIQRLCEHMTGFQHIDLSLKKHKLFSDNNPYGWKVNFYNFDKEDLDDKERYFIKRYIDAGYVVYNHTTGGQDSEKEKLGEWKPAKGYRDGVAQGRKQLAKELNDIIEKHLVIELKDEKKNNKVSQKALDKFWSLLNL